MTAYLTLVCLIILFLVFPIFSQKSKNDFKCGQAKKCNECMGQGPSCSWCYDDEFDDVKEGPGFRCATNETLIQRGCPLNKMESFKSVITDDGTNPEIQPSGHEGEIQLTPRAQSMNVRPADILETEFAFQSISDYPVDLYFLIDLSYTMRDDLETVSALTNDIAHSMRQVTKQLRLGFGAFVDKPVFPFVVPTPEYLSNPCLSVGNEQLHCDPPFLYKHIVSLTDNFEEFKEKTKLTRPSGNLDSPEGGLDALLQVARCQGQVGWRATARKIVLLASDGGFHLAGDGRIAGLVKPPPTDCRLQQRADRFNASLSYLGWHDAHYTDYPSVGEVAQVLSDTNISVIFATTADLQPLYTRLAEFLPSAAVGILSDSSTNIVRLLRENYEKIANKAELTIIYDSDKLDVKVLTKCHGEFAYSAKMVCQHHPVGGRIDYKLHVTPKKCFVGHELVTLKMIALDDQAVLAVSSACNCPTCSRLTGAVDSSTLLPVAEPEVSPSSEESLEAGSELGTLPLAVRRCSARGRLVCGSCQCQRGHTGDFCECDAARWPEHRLADMLAECTQPGAKQPCSGRGRCTCGRCKCQQSRFDGRFCECDRQGCKRASDDNQVCGGPQRGVCRCDGICECKPGYTGDRCDCMQSERNCIDPTGPVEPKCSGHGVCDCGQCFCNSGYTGKLCNELQGGESALCTDRDVEVCVQCLRSSLIGAFDDEIIEDIGPADRSIYSFAQLHSSSSNTEGASGKTDRSLQRAIFRRRYEAIRLHDNGLNEFTGYASWEYAWAASQCQTECNSTSVVDTRRVRLVDQAAINHQTAGGGSGSALGGGASSGNGLGAGIEATDESSDSDDVGSAPSGQSGLVVSSSSATGSNLCIIYTADNCRVLFTYRYSDAIYVDLNIVRESECTKTINIVYIVIGVIAGIVFGGLILLLIYKLVITIDDKREHARFMMTTDNMKWEMAENPIFQPPTTKVMNPTFDENLY